MEIVSFSYYSYQPRLRVYLRLWLHTVPVMGDYIHIPGTAISEISKKMVLRDIIMDFGAEFIVVKRTKYLTTAVGEDWRISIAPVVPFENLI